MDLSKIGKQTFEVETFKPFIGRKLLCFLNTVTAFFCCELNLVFVLCPGFSYSDMYLFPS